MHSFSFSNKLQPRHLGAGLALYYGGLLHLQKKSCPHPQRLLCVYIYFMEQKTLVILGSARKLSDTGKFVELVLHHIEYKLIDLLDWKINGYTYSHQYSPDDQYHILT